MRRVEPRPSPRRDAVRLGSRPWTGASREIRAHGFAPGPAAARWLDCHGSPGSGDGNRLPAEFRQPVGAGGPWLLGRRRSIGQLSARLMSAGNRSRTSALETPANSPRVRRRSLELSRGSTTRLTRLNPGSQPSDRWRPRSQPRQQQSRRPYVSSRNWQRARACGLEQSNIQHPKASMRRAMCRCG